ncbi:hypothetical protein PN462_01785 [Spirulina sp. CS-785/01]|uniref:hypothetical protein n=1 Tax=Spirulina sp. CS-785/01 TaxID=3021716 RepID=UPI00232E2110|nr:hypothetical protein [Spirulina sp. CS-785/01]MDB9311815.1 hypothetical protein [Spirulina sp. CS-785/01]
MKSLFSTQCVALSLSAGIGLGSVLIGATPSEAQVTINVTGGSVSGLLSFDIIHNPTGTLITPYGVYTGPFAAGEINNEASTTPGTTTFQSFNNNDFTGNAYVNGTSTPFTGNLDLTVDSAWTAGSNVSRNITDGTITLNTPTTLDGFSFEAPVTPPTPPTPPAPPAPPASPTPVTPPTTSVTPPTTSVTPPASPAPVTPPAQVTPPTTTIPELTATNFTTPEPLTEPGGVGQALLRSQEQQAQQFRPNGVHTRIIPTWTPGLYQ